MNHDCPPQVRVDAAAAAEARASPGGRGLSCIVVLRLVGGQDHFLTVHALVVPSCFGVALDELASLPLPLRRPACEARGLRGGAESSLGDADSSLGDATSSLGDATSSLGDAKSSLGDAKSSLGDAKSSLGDAKSSLGDATSSLGDAQSSLGDAKSSLDDATRRQEHQPAWHGSAAPGRDERCARVALRVAGGEGHLVNLPPHELLTLLHFLRRHRAALPASVWEDRAGGESEAQRGGLPSLDVRSLRGDLSDAEELSPFFQVDTLWGGHFSTSLDVPPREVLAVLAPHGADAADTRGRTPLWVAAEEEGRREVAELRALLDGGAGVAQLAARGVTAAAAVRTYVDHTRRC
jgi:hypothetical protein